jgi:hypothetical protein
MTIISLADCCRLLVIDPKTLNRWLHLAQLSVQPHPWDSRLKCLTSEQLQQVAATHRRTLPALGEQPIPPETRASLPPSDVISASVLSSAVSDVSAPLMTLTVQLGSLQAHIASLQHQLELLTEQLQKEQQWRTRVNKTREESSPDSSQASSSDSSQASSSDSSQASSLDSSQASSLDSSQASSSDSSQASSQASSPDSSQASSPEKDRSVPIDRRKHPHVLPLVEYGAQGTYVVISPEQGLLSFEPDSPAWFAWLSTLPSFRFVGKSGRFTAFRGYQCSSRTSWWAHRQIHNHSHRRRLGLTALVTIECLEQAASSLQALVP